MSPEKQSRKPCPDSGRCAHAAREPSTTRLQVVQRSLSGGFLSEDAELLNANARSMFDEAGHYVLGAAPDESPTAQGGSLQPIGSPRSRL